METKQIVPDKNLFGESNVAANVVIQLSTVPARIRASALSRRNQNSRLKSQSNKLSDVIKDPLENVIATPSVVLSKSIDDNHVQGKANNQSNDNQGEIQSDGESEDQSEGERAANDCTTFYD